ncbi:MAG: zinc ABC transporter substrate-binding protein [Treponema sp.]|nr:zinc ABC transporter substrate-binding protein [Treponema sp.]
MIYKVRVFFVFILILTITSCTRHLPKNDSIIIAVSIPPQAWFVSEIAGDKASVLVIVPPGQNPHNYEPTPRQIQSLSSADAWILSGTEFEIALRPRIESLFPDMLIISGTNGVNFRLLEAHDHDDDHGDHDHEHHVSYNVLNSALDHSSLIIDRHTWLGQQPALILADHIFKILCLLDKENEDYYFINYTEAVSRINSAFDKLREELAPLNGKSVFVYHPSFGYFFDEFGIIQEAVETGGKEPTPRQLNDLIEKITAEKPAAIFVQTQFPVNAAKTIADTAGARVIELDPLAEDWLSNIIFMGERLKELIN